MNTNDLPNGEKTDEKLDEELVAYADGELDAESVRRLESRLAAEPEFRRRLQSLERTWEMLDDLSPSPAAAEPLVRSTLEMVAIAANDELEQSRAEQPRKLRRQRLLVAFGVCLAAIIGVFGVWFFQTDPNRNLLENLSLLERFDEYRQVGNIAFLRQLRDENLFTPKTTTSTASVQVRAEDMAARRARVEALPLDQKQELAKTLERFLNLSSKERAGLQRLHEDLRNDPDAERLRAIMHDYCEWLKKFSAYSLIGLAEMSPKERLQWIKEKVNWEKLRDLNPRLSDKDAKTLAAWQRDTAERHMRDLQAMLKDDDKRAFAKADEQERRRIYSRRLFQAIMVGKSSSLMTDEDLAKLREQLSDEAKKQLEGKTSLEQWRLVSRWSHPRGNWRIGERGPRGAQPPDIDERLANFFEKLNENERDRLLTMPGDEMQRTLLQMYQSRMKMPENAPPWPEGPRRGNHHLPTEPKTKTP